MKDIEDKTQERLLRIKTIIRNTKIVKIEPNIYRVKLLYGPRKDLEKLFKNLESENTEKYSDANKFLYIKIHTELLDLLESLDKKIGDGDSRPKRIIKPKSWNIPQRAPNQSSSSEEYPYSNRDE